MDLKVLAIEDNPEDAAIYRRVLCGRDQSGCQLRHAETAEEGLSLYDRERPDCVLLDYNLPDCTGLDVVAVLLERDDPLVPVIMLTGSGHEAVAVEALKLGVRDYLVKDVDGEYTRLLPLVLDRVMQEQQLRVQELQHEAALAEYRNQLEELVDERTQQLRKSEQRAHAIIETIAEGLVILDEAGETIFSNPQAQRLLGDWGLQMDEALIRDMDTPGECYEQVITSADGRKRVLEARWTWMAQAESHGEEQTRLFSLSDITERHRVDELQSRLSLILDAIPELVAFADSEYRVEYINPAGRSLLGIGPEDDVSPLRLLDLFPDEAQAGIRDNILASLPVMIRWHGESNLRTQEGRPLPAEQSLICHKTPSGQVDFFSTIARDIRERKDYERQLERSALYDHLTGLPNRALLLNRLGKAIKQCARNPDYSYAVLFIDLDRFKRVNDSLGHKAGDILLCEVADRFSRCLRAEDTLARFSGDEFTILVQKQEWVASAGRLAERLLTALHEPVVLDGNRVQVSASIGIAVGNASHKYPEELLRNADLAMYRGKAKGGGAWEMFDESMAIEASRRIKLEDELHSALEQDQFYLCYQPIFSLSGQGLTSFEALVRWNHPVHGPISPEEFIFIAELSGQILAIGEWVLRTACWQLVEWHRAFANSSHLGISVNLSPRQFDQDGFVEMVAGILQETGVRPDQVTLEITEGIIMKNTTRNIAILQRLQDLGLRLSMDDFGTGYSSLSYLHRFPLNTLKIDRSFIQGLNDGVSRGRIVETIITLAKQLDMNVVAEGVEQLEHVEFLEHLGCDFAQGYYFGKPLEIESAKQLLH
jgi:diguanylate cyclase (GGDEF)-like protein/PAS domain S-box-containing protein